MHVPAVVFSLCMPDDLHFMRLALEQARASAIPGEVPIGAVLVHNDADLARSGNRTTRDNDPTAHAEIVVLRKPRESSATIALPTPLCMSRSNLARCAPARSSRRVSKDSFTAPMIPKGAPPHLFPTSLQRQIESSSRSHSQRPGRGVRFAAAILLRLPSLNSLPCTP